jgi:hypothetical protein
MAMVIYTLDIKEEMLVTMSEYQRDPEGIDDFSGQHIPIHHIHSISKLRRFQKYLQFWWFKI